MGVFISGSYSSCFTPHGCIIVCKIVCTLKLSVKPLDTNIQSVTKKFRFGFLGKAKITFEFKATTNIHVISKRC